MIKPDGSWVCPVCGLGRGGHPQIQWPTCWHGGGPFSDNGKGCSTWYGGRLLHLSKEELEALKGTRQGGYVSVMHACGRHLARLGFLVSAADRLDCYSLTAEGENLCRHLWGTPR